MKTVCFLNSLKNAKDFAVFNPNCPIWQNYSWELSASWLDVPKDLESIINQVESADNFKSYADWLES